MAYNDKPLDNPINWSFKAFSAFAINVRVHVTFLIGAIVLIAMELPEPGTGIDRPTGRLLIDALGSYALLFFIVLVHEFGHCFGARFTGGEADEILLWPLGGLAFTSPPHEPRAHMITTLAGPSVNVIFCAISSAVLVVWTGSIGGVPWNPLHPVTPVDGLLLPTAGQYWLMRFFGISYVLLLINMFPIFPFDGGRVLQAWLWARRGYRSSMNTASSTGMIGAIVIGLFGLLVQEYLLLMIAVFGYLTCWQQRRMIREGALFESEYGPEFGENYESEKIPERKPGWVARWRERRAAERARKDAERERYRLELVESALKKVSESGMDSLSPEQQRALEEETRRKQIGN